MIADHRRYTPRTFRSLRQKPPCPAASQSQRSPRPRPERARLRSWARYSAPDYAIELAGFGAGTAAALVSCLAAGRYLVPVPGNGTREVTAVVRDPARYGGPADDGVRIAAG